MADVTTRRLNVIIDESGAAKALDTLTAKEKKLIAEIEKGNKAGKDMTKSITELGNTKGKIEQLSGVISGKLAPTLRQTETAARNLKRELDNMSSNAPGYAAKFAKFKEVSATLDQMKGKVVGVRSSLKDTFTGNFLANLATGAIGQIASIGSSILDTGVEFEKFGAVLKVALGSQGEAEKVMDQITAFAAATPFQVDEITGSFVKLVNRGFKPTNEELTKLGDLAASQGKSFDQLTEALLDAQTGEFERLKEFGIKAKKANGEVTISFKGQTIAVKDNEAAIRGAILSLGELTGVSGSMAEVSKTTGGQISNLKDELSQLANTLFKAVKPAIDVVVKGLIGLISLTRQGVGSLKALSGDVQGFANDLAQSVGDKAYAKFQEDRKNKINGIVESFKGLTKQLQDEQIGFLVKASERTTNQLNAAIKDGNKKAIRNLRANLMLITDTLSAVQATRDVGAVDPIIDPNAKEKADKAKKEAEARRKELADLLKDIQKLEQGLVADSFTDEYLKALNAISVKYDDFFKRTAGNLKLNERVLHDFISELQIVNRQFADVDPGAPGDPNEIQNRISGEVAAITSTNQKNEKLFKLELDALQKVGRAKLEAEKALLHEQMVQEIAESGHGQNEILLIKEKYLQKGKELEEQFANDSGNIFKHIKDEFEKGVGEGLVAVGELTVSIASQINDVLDGLGRARLNRLQSEHDAERAILDNQLDQKITSRKSYDSKVKALDAKYARERKELEAKQFKRQQAIQIAEAIINTAQAVLKAQAVGYPAAIPLMVLAAAIGAAQIAVIASQKAPTFAKGGFVPQGSSHSEGGIGIRDNRTGRYLGTMEGDEPIISKPVYKANKPLVDNLLQKGWSRDFTPVTPGWMSSMPRQVSMPRITSTYTRHFADGGFLPGPGSASNDTSTALLRAILEQVSRDKASYVVFGEYEAKGNLINTIRTAGTIN